MVFCKHGSEKNSVVKLGHKVKYQNLGTELFNVLPRRSSIESSGPIAISQCL